MTLEYIKSDLCRYVGKDNVTLKKFIWHYFFNSGFKFSFWFRLAKSKSAIRYIAKFNHKILSQKYMLDIPVETEIGYGFYIGHGKCVVINPTTKIGNNVNVSQFTSIGSNCKKAAVIGDNVYIGPNVCIVDDVVIGNNVKIGAGAVVTKDVPENATAAGVPAKVLTVNEEPNCHVNRRWLTEEDNTLQNHVNFGEKKDAFTNFSLCSNSHVQCKRDD